MVTENCKKIEPVVVKLCSKTNIPLFSEHGVVYSPSLLPLCVNTRSADSFASCKRRLTVCIYLRHLGPFSAITTFRFVFYVADRVLYVYVDRLIVL